MRAKGRTEARTWAGLRGICWAAMACCALGASEVKLALILARTGISADENLPAQDSAELAVAELNAAGGLLGRPIRLVLLDNASTPLGSKQAAEQAASQGVIGVIGACRSSNCLAMIPAIRNARIPMICPTATNPEVTLGSPFIFRACFTDEFQGRALARFARRELGTSSAMVLTNMTENYSVGLVRTFAASYQALGGQVVGVGEYQGNAVDFTAILATLKRLRPQVVFLPGYPRDSGLIISQAASSGLHPVFLGADAWDVGRGVSQVAGPAMEGAFHSSQWYADSPNPRNRALKRIYQKRFGPGSFNSMQIPLTYDAVMLFADAVKRANSLDPERIAEALRRTRGFPGTTGAITFDQDRNPVGKDVAMLQYQKGAWHYFKSIGPGL